MCLKKMKEIPICGGLHTSEKRKKSNCVEHRKEDAKVKEEYNS